MAISQNVVPYQISDFYFMRSQMGLGLPSSISNLAVHGDLLSVHKAWVGPISGVK